MTTTTTQPDTLLAHITSGINSIRMSKLGGIYDVFVLPGLIGTFALDMINTTDNSRAGWQAIMPLGISIAFWGLLGYMIFKRH